MMTVTEAAIVFFMLPGASDGRRRSPGASDGAGTKISDKMSQCRRTVGTIRLAFIPTASFQILPRLLEKIRSTLPLVKVELREGSENPQITGLRSGTFDVCIGHLSPTYDQIQNMLLIRERLVVALPKGHRAARKKNVGLRDLEGEPSHALERSVARPASNDRGSLSEEPHAAGQISMAEHFQTGVNLTKARAGYMFLPSSAKDFVPDGSCYELPCQE